MTRKMTNRLLEAVAEGLLSEHDVILACVNYMSEDEVADMARCEFGLSERGFDVDEDDEDDEDEDA